MLILGIKPLKSSKLIGLEFSYRSARFGEFVPRLKTGNLVFKREAVLDVGGFDESVKANQDMIFGYRLTEKGYKIRFDPSASIKHYHRSNFAEYFLQQYRYALDIPAVYIKHRKYAFGDHLTDFWMNSQPFIFVGLIIFLMGYAVLPSLFWIMLILSGVLLTQYIWGTLEILLHARNKLALLLPVIFFVRTFAWTLGGVKYCLRRVLRY